MKHLLLLILSIGWMSSTSATILPKPKGVKSAKLEIIKAAGIYNKKYAKAPNIKLTLMRSTYLNRNKGATSPTGICTTDINRWGHSSACACKKGSHYNNKIGLCVPDNPKSVESLILNMDGSKTYFFISKKIRNNCGATEYTAETLVPHMGLNYVHETLTLIDHSTNDRCNYRMEYEWQVEVKKIRHGRSGNGPNRTVVKAVVLGSMELRGKPKKTITPKRPKPRLP